MKSTEVIGEERLARMLEKQTARRIEMEKQAQQYEHALYKIAMWDGGDPRQVAREALGLD